MNKRDEPVIRQLFTDHPTPYAETWWPWHLYASLTLSETDAVLESHMENTRYTVVKYILYKSINISIYISIYIYVCKQTK